MDGLRIIPARAGFTANRGRSPFGRRDHPRSRGVYLYAILPDWNVKGSSPLARGLHSKETQNTESRRIIPARAGFTRVPSGVFQSV